MNFSTGRGKNYGVEHFLASFSGFLSSVLEKQLELPQGRADFLISMGAIYVQGKRCIENTHIDEGTYIRAHQNPRRFPVQNFIWPDQLIFENENLIVMDKPSGLPVPPTVDNIQENLCRLLSLHTGQEIHVTHRLDQATSGLLIFAKNKAAQALINGQFQRGEIRKHYRALVHGQNLPDGEWLHFMEPSPRAPKKVSKEPQESWLPCRLKLESQIPQAGNRTEVLIQLLTGRTHQIRAQLACAGFPIVGDIAYGSSVQLAEFEKICLQASEIEFPDLMTGKKSLALSRVPWAPSV